MLKEYSLEGKKALITGGSTGLGRATAVVFAEAGADVAIAARTIKNLESAAEEIRKHGTRVITIPTDVSDSSQVDTMVAKATEEFGRVDILVNAAAMSVAGPIAPLPTPPPPTAESIITDYTTGCSDETFHKVMTTTLASVFYACRAVAPQMLERRQGKIVTIVSTAGGAMAEAYTGAYGTSKAGVRMLSKILATEWAPYNINVNCISPGWFITEMSRKGFDIPEIHKERLEGVPLGHLTDNRDLGLLALYFASSASDWMTGQSINLDGGLTSVCS